MGRIPPPLPPIDRQRFRREWEAIYGGIGTKAAVPTPVSDCKFCGISSEPDKSGNCRGCGAKR